jgi:hypothetical protein
VANKDILNVNVSSGNVISNKVAVQVVSKAISKLVSNRFQWHNWQQCLTVWQHNKVVSSNKLVAKAKFQKTSLEQLSTTKW